MTTTPTTQREADERTLYKQWQSTNPTRTSTDGFEIWQARAAIDQTDAKTRMDAHTTSYAQGYRAGIEMGKALAADEAAATDQPSAGQVDDASDCTEPNRKACPRLCIDFCNAAEEARATPTAPQAADWQNVMQQRLYDLRKDVSTACQLLADNEWAEHFATTPEGRVLESAIAKLVGSAPQAASQQAGAGIDAVRKAVLGEAVRGVVDIRTETDGEQAVLDEVITRLHIMKGAPQAATTASAAVIASVAATLERSGHTPGEASKLAAEGYANSAADRAEIASTAPVQAAQPALPATDLYMLRRVIECAEKLDERPRPMCRDCADENGTCPNSGLECDMPALIASAKGIYNRLAAPGAAQTTDARDAALEEAAQLCDSLGGDIDERNVDEVKLCANSLAWSIRRLKSDRATHPTDKGQTNE